MKWYISECNDNNSKTKSNEKMHDIDIGTLNKIQTIQFVKSLSLSSYSKLGNEQFNTPSGVAIDSKDNVYVADTYNNRIQKFSPDGTFNKTGGSEGNDIWRFNLPSGVAIDSKDNVYVADTYNNRIQIFH